LKLREITRQIISSLEEKSGYTVQVIEEPTLPTLATIRIARGNIPAHILSYRPGAKNESPDFTICWQCSLALRMYESTFQRFGTCKCKARCDLEDAVLSLAVLSEPTIQLFAPKV